MLKQQFPEVPVLALTATATRRVCQDLLEILHISACETFHTPVNRPNLYYSVRDKPANASEAAADVVDWIREHYDESESGIIYCQTRKDCEALAGELAERGMLASYYHADMDPATRKNVHLRWSKGAAPQQSCVILRRPLSGCVVLIYKQPAIMQEPVGMSASHIVSGNTPVSSVV